MVPMATKLGKAFHYVRSGVRRAVDCGLPSPCNIGLVCFVLFRGTAAYGQSMPLSCQITEVMDGAGARAVAGGWMCRRCVARRWAGEDERGKGCTARRRRYKMTSEKQGAGRGVVYGMVQGGAREVGEREFWLVRRGEAKWSKRKRGCVEMKVGTERLRAAQRSEHSLPGGGKSVWACSSGKQQEWGRGGTQQLGRGGWRQNATVT